MIIRIRQAIHTHRHGVDVYNIDDTYETGYYGCDTDLDEIEIPDDIDFEPYRGESLEIVDTMMDFNQALLGKIDRARAGLT